MSVDTSIRIIFRSESKKEEQNQGLSFRVAFSFFVFIFVSWILSIKQSRSGACGPIIEGVHALVLLISLSIVCRVSLISQFRSVSFSGFRFPSPDKIMKNWFSCDNLWFWLGGLFQELGQKIRLFYWVFRVDLENYLLWIAAYLDSAIGYSVLYIYALVCTAENCIYGVLIETSNLIPIRRDPEFTCFQQISGQG